MPIPRPAEGRPAVATGASLGGGKTIAHELAALGPSGPHGRALGQNAPGALAEERPGLE